MSYVENSVHQDARNKAMRRRDLIQTGLGSWCFASHKIPWLTHLAFGLVIGRDTRNVRHLKPAFHIEAGFGALGSKHSILLVLVPMVREMRQRDSVYACSFGPTSLS